MGGKKRGETFVSARHSLNTVIFLKVTLWFLVVLFFFIHETTVIT